MNNFVTVYELLGLFKDGKIKEGTYIKYYDRIWENDEKLYVCLKNIINKLDEGAIELNDQVKILEEDKSIIEKITLKGEDIRFGIMSEWLEFNPNENEQKICSAIESIGIKLNEVISYINRKEDK